MERGGEHFERRVFSPGEIAYCRKHKSPYPHFAARFAAKEAYGKATGLGIGPTGELVEIEVKNLENGRPDLVFSGKAQEFFAKQGTKEVHLSLSHDGDVAIANVILVG